MDLVGMGIWETTFLTPKGGRADDAMKNPEKIAAFFCIVSEPKKKVGLGLRFVPEVPMVSELESISFEFARW